MLGEGLGLELKILASRDHAVDSVDEPTSGGKLDPEKYPDFTQGLIPRAVEDLFRILGDSVASVEYTVRCSFVEIYLEKICDLIQVRKFDFLLGCNLQCLAYILTDLQSNIVSRGEKALL